MTLRLTVTGNLVEVDRGNVSTTEEDIDSEDGHGKEWNSEKHPQPAAVGGTQQTCLHTQTHTRHTFGNVYNE